MQAPTISECHLARKSRSLLRDWSYARSGSNGTGMSVNRKSLTVSARFAHRSRNGVRNCGDGWCGTQHHPYGHDVSGKMRLHQTFHSAKNAGFCIVRCDPCPYGVSTSRPTIDTDYTSTQGRRKYRHVSRSGYHARFQAHLVQRHRSPPAYRLDQHDECRRAGEPRAVLALQSGVHRTAGRDLFLQYARGPA